MDVTYTAEQKAKRDSSIWTKVQMILAPVQFLSFIISVILVGHYLQTGQNYALANASVLIKISLLWLITITGMIWEKEMYGKWFMAKEFFWEDLFNAIALFMHNLYFVAHLLGWSDRNIMILMLIAYTSYLLNFAQFTIKGLQMRKSRQLAEEAAL